MEQFCAIFVPTIIFSNSDRLLKPFAQTTRRPRVRIPRNDRSCFGKTSARLFPTNANERVWPWKKHRLMSRPRIAGRSCIIAAANFLSARALVHKANLIFIHRNTPPGFSFPPLFSLRRSLTFSRALRATFLFNFRTLLARAFFQNLF